MSKVTLICGTPLGAGGIQVKLAQVVVVVCHRPQFVNSKGKWGDIEKEKIGDGFRGVSNQDGGLDCGAIGHSLIRVD